MSEKQSKEQWVAQYEKSHEHPFNQLCHLLGIPMVTVAIPLFVALFIFPEWWIVPTALYVTGWILLFIGHAVEGKRPEFLRDWRFLFFGVRWWYDKVRGRR